MFELVYHDTSMRHFFTNDDMALPQAEGLSSLELVLTHLRSVAAQSVPAAKKARYAEWWAHR